MSDWWASLRHGGLLLSPSKVAEFLPQGPEPLPAWLEERLRRDLARLEMEGGESRLLDTVLEQVLGLGGRADADSGAWVKGGALSAEWTRRSITGEAVRPRRVWQGPTGPCCRSSSTTRPSAWPLRDSEHQGWFRLAQLSLGLPLILARRGVAHGGAAEARANVGGASVAFRPSTPSTLATYDTVAGPPTCIMARSRFRAFNAGIPSIS